MQEPQASREPNVEGTPESTALYIASFAQELAQLAKSHGFDSLSYILEMARLEADQVAKG
jgi:glutamate synthase domain-containing protein 2